jgi:hypothetical protein
MRTLRDLLNSGRNARAGLAGLATRAGLVAVGVTAGLALSSSPAFARAIRGRGATVPLQSHGGLTIAGGLAIAGLLIGIAALATAGWWLSGRGAEAIAPEVGGRAAAETQRKDRAPAAAKPLPGRYEPALSRRRGRGDEERDHPTI